MNNESPIQTFKEIDEVIEELKNALLESYQVEAIEAIEKAVNKLEVSKRNIYTLETTARKVRPTVRDEWGEAEAWRTCAGYAARALTMPEPKNYWIHSYNLKDKS